MKPRRILLLSTLIAAALVLIVPLISADRFAERIQKGLERALQRRVEINGPVHVMILGGPGFSVERVVIHDLPEFGAEPLAYVAELSAVIDPVSLLSGALRFRTLHLLEPSINVGRASNGAWNIAPLFGSTEARPPRMEIEGGRLSLRLNHRKSVYYLANREMSVSPSSEGGVDFDFEGEPARTDRAAASHGLIRVRGRFRPHAADGRTIGLEVELERGSLTDVAALVRGHDVGLHGWMSSRVFLEGSPASLSVKGDIELANVHRWDMMQHRGPSWRTRLAGSIDLLAGTLILETPAARSDGARTPVKVRVNDLLTTPHGGVIVWLHAIPVQDLVTLASHMGTGMPEEVRVRGTADGAVGYQFPDTNNKGWQGSLRLSAVQVMRGNSTALRTSRARIRVNGPLWELLPVPVVTERGEILVSGTVAPSGISARLSTRRMDLEALDHLFDNLAPQASVPFLQHARGGSWSGLLEHRQDGWHGLVDVEKTQLVLPGLAEPLMLARARVYIDRAALRVTEMEGSAGAIDFLGSYFFDPAARRPHRVEIAAGAANAQEIEQLFDPVLRRERSFLARTLRIFTRKPPESLNAQSLDGALRVRRLSLAGQEFDDVRAQLDWEGSRVQLNQLTAKWNDGSVQGSLEAELSGPEPEYVMTGRLFNVRFQNGRAELRGYLEASGRGGALAGSFRAAGSFEGRGIAFGADTLRAVSGCYELAWRPSGPELALHSIEAVSGGESLYGDGETLAGGRLRVQLAGVKTQLLLSGKLLPLELSSAMIR